MVIVHSLQCNWDGDLCLYKCKTAPIIEVEAGVGAASDSCGDEENEAHDKDYRNENVHSARMTDILTV